MQCRTPCKAHGGRWDVPGVRVCEPETHALRRWACRVGGRRIEDGVGGRGWGARVRQLVAFASPFFSFCAFVLFKRANTRRTHPPPTHTHSTRTWHRSRGARWPLPCLSISCHYAFVCLCGGFGLLFEHANKRPAPVARTHTRTHNTRTRRRYRGAP